MSITEADLLFAHKLADAAAEAIRPHFRRPLDVGNKGGIHFDPVTAADRGAEAAIRSILQTERPDDGIIGEEYGSEPGTSGRDWVLDPIDGTRTFISGLTEWGTLIAMNEAGVPVLGILNQPVTNERFIGETADGACRAHLIANGEKRVLKTRTCTTLSDAAVMTTHPWDYFTADEEARFRALAQTARMSRFGGDCFAYAMLAMGFVDLVIESGLKAWDIAALIPIVEGAGGSITDWTGQPKPNGGRVVAAATPELLAEALTYLADA